MSQWREDILKITSTEQPISFFTWITLLTFFNKHKDQLDLEDIKIILDKSEEHRVYLNSQIRSKDYIEKHDVNPNIYEYLEKFI